jgi:uncharacterized protein YabE (DUF348 family)
MGLRFHQLAWTVSLRSLLVLPLALLLIVAVSGFVWAQNDVKLIIDDQCLFVKTHATSVGELLKENGIKIAEKDAVSPAPSVKVREGMTVTVQHSIPVFVQVDGHAKKVTSSSRTVGEVLEQAQIKLKRNDRVTPAVSTRLVRGMKIEVTRISKQVEAVQVTVPYQTTEEPDPTLTQGFRQVAVIGQPGIYLRMYDVVKENGRESSRKLKCERVLAAPVGEVIKVGTKPLKNRELAKIIAPGEVSRGIYRTIVMVATGYTPGYDGGMGTASGVPPRRGIVAVDPRIIPLGTRLYIEGYGEAVAGDTGGKIKGNRIDLCFDSLEEARAFGRRQVVVQILP